MAVAALALAASGCMVGPDYENPGAPMSAEFKELDGWKIATPRDDIDRGDWWSVYDDPTLSGLLREVDVSNQTIISAEAAYRQSVALVQQARAGLFPSLAFSYAGSRWHQGAEALAAQGFAGFPATTLTTVTMEPQLIWTADVWGKLRRQVQSNVNLAQASAADLANVRLSARTQLALAYFNLRAADSLQKLLHDTVAQYRAAYEITQDRHRVGAASDYDVEIAGTQMDTARAQEISVGIQRARLEHAIAVLVGRPPADVSIAWAPLPRHVPVVPVSLPSALLERRPDVAAAERAISSKNALVGVAVAAYFPDISLSGGFGSATFPWATFGYAGTTAFPIAAANQIWAVGGNLAEVIFDAGLRREQVAAAMANYYQAVADYRQTVLTALEQVETQLSDLRVLAEQARALDRAVRRARKTVKITLDRYRIGTVDYTAVVQAQNLLLSNEVSALSVRQSQFIASVTLIQALGGGWDSSWLPTPEFLEHWRTCVSVRATLHGHLDPEMPPCL
jgi:NodT family efflux transporter outer membrane factor (OMF) lipoprotein